MIIRYSKTEGRVENPFSKIFDHLVFPINFYHFKNGVTCFDVYNTEFSSATYKFLIKKFFKVSSVFKFPGHLLPKSVLDGLTDKQKNQQTNRW